MPQRSAGIHGHVGHANVPRAWVILGLGTASWLLVAALIAATTTAFQALSGLVG